MTGASGLWDLATYSPRLLRFWYARYAPGSERLTRYPHYEALLALAEGDSASQEGERLAWEWRLLSEPWIRGQPVYRRDCLCDYLQSTGYPQTVHCRGGSGDAAGRAARIVADLESAADTLPVWWSVTQEVYRAGGRFDVLSARRQTLARHIHGESEPSSRGDAWRRAIALMAGALGWEER